MRPCARVPPPQPGASSMASNLQSFPDVLSQTEEKGRRNVPFARSNAANYFCAFAIRSQKHLALPALHVAGRFVAVGPNYPNARCRAWIACWTFGTCWSLITHGPFRTFARRHDGAGQPNQYERCGDVHDLGSCDSSDSVDPTPFSRRAPEHSKVCSSCPGAIIVLSGAT